MHPATTASTAVPADLIRFHGHECPGVTIGYRMAKAVMDAVPADGKLVAIAENRACGVDALQWVTGCTAGKANLVLKDYGKQAYTLYSAETRKGVRVLLNGDKVVPAGVRKDQAEFIRWLMATDASSFLTLTPVQVEEVDPPRTKETAPCSACGEPVNLTHLRESGPRKLCIPCAQRQAGAAQ
jgi:formylmethanofuran dehydrogenase subunit E